MGAKVMCRRMELSELFIYLRANANLFCNITDSMQQRQFAILFEYDVYS